MFESYYGFSAQPFQLSPDPAFFYGSRGHKRAFSYLQYGLYQGEGFITLTGEVGAGKTMLIRSLLKQLDSSKVVAAQLVSTQLNAHSLLLAVATALGIPTAADCAAMVRCWSLLWPSGTGGMRGVAGVCAWAPNVTSRTINARMMCRPDEPCARKPWNVKTGVMTSLPLDS